MIEKVIPSKPPAQPFITNQAREVYKKRQDEKPKAAPAPHQAVAEEAATGEKPSLELKIYGQPNAGTGAESGDKTMLVPTYPATTVPMLPPGIKNDWAYQFLNLPTQVQTTGPNVNIPVQKVINLQLPGPTGAAHMPLTRLYDDIWPEKEFKFTSTTIGERLQVCHYMRNGLVKRHDGEDINIDANRTNTLLSYIKILEVNPNYYDVVYTNPYKSLPMGLILYRSGYPLRYDEKLNRIALSKTAVGLNIRIYSLTISEFVSHYTRDPFFKYYDVWRELGYYEFIREEIIKKKICPNFVSLIAWFSCSNKTVDFFRLREGMLTQKERLTIEYQKYLQLHKATWEPDFFTKEVNRRLGDVLDRLPRLPDEIDARLQCYSGHSLIILTEAPHHNIYQWASRLYENYGVVKKMVQPGFHGEKVWFSILMQLAAALYVMQIKGLKIRQMSLEDNVYIKDLQVEGGAAGYWKYKIDGVDYYVPNYGYLVMIDSNYKDIRNENEILEFAGEKREYKFYSNVFGTGYDMTVLRAGVYENFKNLFSPNNFGPDHTANGVNRPPESVVKLLTDIHAANPASQDIGEIILDKMKMFLHNRVGKYLLKDEVANIRSVTRRDFKKGDMVVYERGPQEFTWAVFIKDLSDPGTCQIMGSPPGEEDPRLMSVQKTSLHEYNPSEVIKQIYKASDAKLGEEDLLETYHINAN